MMIPWKGNSAGQSNRAPAIAVAFWAGLAALGFATPAKAVLEPGAAAPPLALPDSQGETRRFDASSSVTLLIVFSKPDDRYTSSTLGAINRMLTQFPALGRGVKRLAVLSRGDDDRAVDRLKLEAGPGWSVLVDREDQAYREYKIIATPTVVIAGPDGRVAAVNPGYDFGMEARVRTALAQLAGVDLEQELAPEKPDMDLQIGRRLAARGVWERALPYFLKAAETGPLPAEAQLDLAEIYVELAQSDKAIPILEKFQSDLKYGDRARALILRIRQNEGGPRATPKPPKVVR